MYIEQKVGQLFFIGIPGAELDGQTRDLLSEVQPSGVCLFARNIKEAKQTRELLDGIYQISYKLPFLSLDQEGGLVDRLRRVLTPMPAPASLRNTDDASRLGELIAEAIRILGFNMDFAPVVDVIDDSRDGTPNGIQTRTFGRSKEQVAEFSEAFLKNIEAGGILGCVKHFPGLGASAVDSHEELPQVLISDEELRSVDLYPYQKLLSGNNRLSVMVAHASFPNVDLQEVDQNGKLLPSSLSSRFVNDLLRNELGFDGLAISDDLEMGAIVKNYGIGDACKMGVNAGLDMLAICASPDAIREGYAAVLSAVKSGEIAESRLDESLVRIERYRSYLMPPAKFGTARLNEISEEIASFKNELT